MVADVAELTVCAVIVPADAVKVGLPGVPDVQLVPVPVIVMVTPVWLVKTEVGLILMLVPPEVSVKVAVLPLLGSVIVSVLPLAGAV